jgi:hypothetical protein
MLAAVSFASPTEFREVMDRVFGFMSTHPDVGPKLRAAEVPQRWEFPDLDMVVNLAGRPEVEDGHNLRWTWSDPAPWSPEVELAMNSDVANRFFQGRENVGMAVARRRIRAGGNVAKMMSLVPITRPVFDEYRALVEREYPHLVL